MAYGYTLSQASNPPISSKAYREGEGQACLQALWSRLQIYNSVAKDEAEDLHRILSTQIEGKTFDALKARLGRIPGGTELQPCPGGDSAAFLMELMLMFNHSAHAPFKRITALPPLSVALHKFVVERFGASKYFNLLDPVYANAAVDAWEKSRRAIVAARLAKYERDAPHRSHSSETAAQAVARAEGHLHDVEEMNYLENCESSRELDAWLLQPEDPILAELRRMSPSPDWMARYRAAASCKMVPSRGWKYESRAQCWARVGITKKG